MSQPADLLATEHDRGLHERIFKPHSCRVCWPHGAPTPQLATVSAAETAPPAAGPREHRRGDGFEPLRAGLQRLRSLVKIDQPEDPAGADRSPLRDRGPDCSRCGGYRWMRQDVPRDDPRFGQLTACPDCFRGFLLQRRIERMWGQLPPKYRGFTLETLAERSAQHRELLVPLLREWLADPDEPWLYLFSPPGHAKTGAGVGLLHAAAQRGSTIALCFVLDLLGRLRATYRSREAYETDEQDLFAALQSADVLLVDDLGLEHHRLGEEDWASEKIHQLLNGRYVERRRTIVTSNLPLQELSARLGHERTASRIGEMTLGDRWCLDLSRLPNLRRSA